MRSSHQASEETPCLGIVIPTLNEADHLPLLLDDLRQLKIPHEVVVADGGSSDGTIPAARQHGALICAARRGRSRQMNAGASLLRTPWLAFLHADCRVPPATIDVLQRHVRLQETRAAHFRFESDRPGLQMALVRLGQRLRQTLSGISYGDQGLVVPTGLFWSLGGYPDVPLMEDILMSRALRDRRALCALDAPLITSARRHAQEGPILRGVKNTALLLRFSMGANLSALAQAYPPTKAEAATALPKTAVMIFAKAPQPGRVKTRLAEGIGTRAATALYRHMGRQVVGDLARSPFEVTVCFTPEGEERIVRAWLGEDVTLDYQGEGDLGARMDRMLRRGLSRSERAIVVGTDAPSVDTSVVTRAARALDYADIVLGPASDGGYVLLGLKRPHPALFEDMEWSTEDVLSETVARARALGLSVTFLEAHSDVDTEADLTPDLRRFIAAQAEG